MKTARNVKAEFAGEVIKAVGGTVGRFCCDDDLIPRIGILFKYCANGNEIDSPVYEMSSRAACYAGWHLFRRGVSDQVKGAINYIFKKVV